MFSLLSFACVGSKKAEAIVLTYSAYRLPGALEASPQHFPNASYRMRRAGRDTH